HTKFHPLKRVRLSAAVCYGISYRFDARTNLKREVTGPARPAQRSHPPIKPSNQGHDTWRRFCYASAGPTCFGGRNVTFYGRKNWAYCGIGIGGSRQYLTMCHWRFVPVLWLFYPSASVLGVWGG